MPFNTKDKALAKNLYTSSKIQFVKNFMETFKNKQQKT